eukprot:737098-Amphidinium_carterae.1
MSCLSLVYQDGDEEEEEDGEQAENESDAALTNRLHNLLIWWKFLAYSRPSVNVVLVASRDLVARQMKCGEDSLSDKKNDSNLSVFELRPLPISSSRITL